MQLLLAQITPTAGSEKAMERIVETVREAIQPIFPDAEVMGFVSGELEGSRAFRVAVPDCGGEAKDLLATQNSFKMMIILYEPLFTLPHK